MQGWVEGSYTGVGGTNGLGDYDPGINTPKLRLGANAGVSFFWYGNLAPGDYSYLFEGNYQNTFTFGNCTIYECIEAFLKPEEAWNIDTKIDDGKPGMGFIINRPSGSTGGEMPNCNTSTGSGAGQAAAATYMLDQTGINCGLYYRGLS